MSFFDPYQLYKREQFTTHTGQVLRKKPPIACGSPITEEELSRYIEILTSLGYNIRPPGVHRPSIQRLYTQDVDFQHDLEQITYLGPDEKFYGVRDIWIQAHNFFFMPYEFDQITGFEVQFAISSFQMCNLDKDDGNYQVQFGFKGGLNYNYASIGPDTRVNIYDCQNTGITFNTEPDSQVYNVAVNNVYSNSRQNGVLEGVRNGYFQQDDPNYFSIIRDNSRETYNALKNNQYATLASMFSPLFMWQFTGYVVPDGLSFIHHIFRVSIRMSYTYFE